jgi:hypothetical protein
MKLEARSEKREARSEKREARSEKREARSEKREASGRKGRIAGDNHALGNVSSQRYCVEKVENWPVLEDLCLKQSFNLLIALGAESYKSALFSKSGLFQHNQRYC